MAGTEEVLDLIRHLKQERLFVNAEKEQLQQLNEQVIKTAEKLCHLAFIAHLQHSNLDSLVFSTGNEVRSSACCHQANLHETINFMDGYKYLSYHDQKFGDFIRKFRASPKLVATCLVLGEKQSYELMQSVVSTAMVSVYGLCVMQEDDRFVLRILKEMIEQQLVPHDNPHRLLRKGSCAFSKVYKLMNEGLFSAKLFLTAALHNPIMRLLMEDEWFYDIDPEKALIRFPQSESQRRFGQPGDPSYEQKLAEYRAVTLNKLVLLTNRFINSIKRNMFCFPQSLMWIASQLYRAITKSEKTDAAAARVMCADLVFTFFICPAICDPEPYGITSDVSISYIARHNLMQVAQILQVLAITRYEDMDPKLMDLYGKFEKDCMSSLLDSMLSGPLSESPPAPHIQLEGVSRTAVLIRPTELQNLVEFLRGLVANMEENEPDRKELEALLSGLPASLLHPSTSGLTPTSSPGHTPPGTPGSGKKTQKEKKDKKRSANLTVPDDGDDLSDTDAGTLEDVLVIPMEAPADCPGMLGELKVLEQECLENRKTTHNIYPGNEQIVEEPEVTEKRTRFSLSHDQDSIGNTSDNIEAVSEGCSSHSVGSEDLEVENENDNDNLSDMMSANVSGRGTPSISGRDTPLSQVSQGEIEEREEREPRRVPDLPVTVQKRNREDVTDRFGKFDIKNELEKDEIKSTVSDTWSTDVLASDSEPPEANQMDRLEEVAEEMARSNLLGVQENILLQVSEVSETASDAWSTDVLASDTDEKQAERLLELDQDDISISSKSQGPDDSEVEYSEETPQASGGASPADGLQGLENLGAVGGVDLSSRPFLTHPKSNAYVRLPRPDRFSDRCSNDSNEDSPRSVSDIINSHNFPTTDDSKRQRLSASLKDVDGHVDHVIQIMDPDSLISKTGFKAKTKRTSNERDFSSAQEQRRIVIIENDNSAERPDELSAGGIPEIIHHPDRDSGIAETPQEEQKSAIDQLVDDISQGLKISEQQNITIHPSRLSATISLFDPLLQESDTDPTGQNEETNLNLEGVAEGIDSNHLQSGELVVKAHSYTVSHIPVPPTLEVGGPILKSGSMMVSPSDKEDQAGGKKISFFKSFKEKFNKGAKRKGSGSSSRSDEGVLINMDRGSSDSGMIAGVRFMGSPDTNQETSDDILDKYRKKPQPDAQGASGDMHLLEPVRGPRDNIVEDEVEGPPMYDPDNLETCQAFHDAKKKLRMVFSTADFQTLPWSFSATRRLSQVAQGCKENDRKDNDLVAMLRMQLAEAINLQDKDLIAQLHETIRCVRQFDHDGTKKLIRSLRDDYKNRTPYISYLVRCRQNLLSTQAHLERLLYRIERDKEICGKHLVSVCVRIFIERREKGVLRFMAEFQRLTVSDERADLVEKFLDSLYKHMQQDPMWQAASDNQLEEGQLAIERYIMSRIYTHAMCPNGDGDFHRDLILSQHIKKLSSVITPSHPDLRIPKFYHSECPWPSAQAEIYLINAYKTPKDKLKCVLNCSSTIMNLLSMASDKSVPAADDFMPVLIFVLIKANPLCLLSTIQYVNSFYEKRLCGEEQYWWMQFSAAVEFIKTMDYNV
ncbi:GTPase-activating protein and VPS9 domain-containing protein 1-like isoform X2 [Lineus longissimus]|uniref:GTPase-activating protein and VPS9 domain-containing protein 1-like isoform X2 n=1 Tax=Lineus longissimus TaxID=88925 RepID=UPI00315DF168